MSRLRRGAIALVASTTGLAGLALTGGTASATHNSPPCLVVTADTTLSGDVGPCDGHGIVVRADNVTLDLNGHTVTGTKRAMEQVGILLAGVSGVTVKNGTVTGFDAGVSIEGGGNNTVTGMDVHGNVNDMIEPIDPRSIQRSFPPTDEQRHQLSLVECDYGDGITTFDSSDNLIEGNTVTGNGPYGGITLVNDSNSNVVRNNHVADNDLENMGVTSDGTTPVWVAGGFHVPAGTPGASRPTSMCGATEVGTPGMGRGRQMQASNIRVEGPGADENLVEANTVVKGGLAGISIHSYVAFPAAPQVPPQDPNLNNVIKGNDVSRTGEDTSGVDTFADGIVSLSSGPIGTVTMPSHSNTIVGNKSYDNFRHGVALHTATHDNTVDRNVATGNGGNGIHVARGAVDNSLMANHGRGNAGFDGFDGNEDCDDNLWRGNNLRTFNQPCVVPGASGQALGRGGAGAGNSADAPGGMMRAGR